jgi:putative peptide zinc metalloprotease protein
MLQLRPTFSESWYRVQALKVRLRPSAQISRQYYRGERWYVVRDPAGNLYHRLSDPAYRFVALLDGTRTINEAWELVGGVMDDDAPTQPEVIQIISQLYSANLIEADVTPDSATLLKRSKNLEQRRLQQRLMNVLFPRIPIWDPNQFLTRWKPVIDGVFSWPMAVLWGVVVIWAAFTIAPLGDRLVSSAKDSVDPSNWFYLWLVFCSTKFLHEMGHAASCRRFGGECHEMGLMFLVFVPTPYVDASSAWGFPNRWKRMFVGAAGMTVEIFVAALCAFVWANTAPGKLIHQLAYNAMLIASVSTVLFNANPLLRYDGYYMLSDFLEIPNLQKRSQDYSLGLIRRKLFGARAREPLPSVGTRYWLAKYAVLSGIYRIFVGLMIVILVAFKVPILGILMSIGGLVTWAVVPIFKAVKYLALDPELHRKRGRAWAWSLAGAAAAVTLVGFIPMTMRVKVEGVVEPVNRQVVRNEAAGFVEAIVATDGAIVKKGDVLVKLRDPVIEHDVETTAANLRAAEIKFRASQAGSKPAQAQADYQEVVAYTKQLDERRRRADKLTIRADVDGQVISPDLVNLPGKYLPRGTELMVVAATEDLYVRSVVSQEDAQFVPTNGGVLPGTSVKLASAVWESLTVRKVEVVNAASDRLPSHVLAQNGGGTLAMDSTDPRSGKTTTKQIELRAYLEPNCVVSPLGHTAPVVPGQRAYLRLTLGKKPLAWQAWRWVQQIIQSHSNSKWF